MNKEQEIEHAKGVVATVFLGGFGLVGMKNLKVAVKTLKKYLEWNEFCDIVPIEYRGI